MIQDWKSPRFLARENAHRIGIKNYEAAKSNKENW